MEISPHSQGQLIYCRGRKDILCGKTGFLIKVLGKAGSYMPSIRRDHFRTSYTNVNTKWITDFNVSLEIIRLPEENRHWSQQSYFRYVSSGKGNKCKNKQIGPHQTEKFLHSQGSCQKNIYDKMIYLIYYS